MSIIFDALNKAQENLQPKKQADKVQDQPKDIPDLTRKDIVPERALQEEANQEKPEAASKAKIQFSFDALKRVAQPKVIVIFASFIIIFLVLLWFIRKPATPKRKVASSNFVESTLEIVPKTEPWSAEVEIESREEQAEEPIEEIVTPEQPQTPIPKLTLNGIFHSEDETSWAIINGKILKVGESIEAAKITEITKKDVKLKFYDVDLILQLK